MRLPEIPPPPKKESPAGGPGQQKTKCAATIPRPAASVNPDCLPHLPPTPHAQSDTDRRAARLERLIRIMEAWP